MKTKLRKHIRFNALNGNGKVRRQAVQEGKHICAQDRQRLEASGKQQSADYTHRFAASTSQEVEGQMRPAAIHSELRDARLMSFMAWAMCLVELALALFMAFTFSIDPFFMALVTLAAIFIVKTALLAIWRSPDRPQTTRRELRNLVIVPSFIITLFALTVLLFSRGPLAIFLAALFSLSLGALSFGICFLSAGLMAYAYSLNWSKHAEKKFNATAKEHAETVQLEEELFAMECELQPKPTAALDKAATNNTGPMEAGQIVRLPATQAALVRSHASKATAHVFNSLLVLLVACWMTGCQQTSWTGSIGAPSVAAAVQPVAVEACQLAIYVDWSLSNKDQALLQASQTVMAALPDLVQAHHAQRVTAYHFGADGWDAEPIKTLELPLLRMATPDEAARLIGVLREENEKKARLAYQTELQQKLASFAPELLLPVNVPEPKCTDLQGLIRRLAQEQHKQLSILITDGAENCAPALQRVELAQPLVIVLLSEKDTTQKLSHELYEQRRQTLAAAVPRAVIVPHFETALPKAIQQAIANVQTKQN